MAGRNPDAQKPNRGEPTDSFLNPVGSVNYTVYGDLGKARHQGNFSNNNPYFEQLMLANNNQDKDALYELAIQWEADYANLNEQREYNQGVLEEQREYDSPVNQIARARAAGINPDLEGSGGSTSSGSGAQMQIPAMADQTGQTKFNNQYDNTSLVFEGINTAANLAGTLATGVSGIMNAVSNMKMIPSETELNEANAVLSGAKAREIMHLLQGKKEGQLIANEGANLQNIGTSISNATNTLSFLAQISNLIDPTADDETLMPYLNSLGVPEQNQPYFRDIIKQLHANPEMRDKYAKAELSARWSEAENARFTNATVAEMTDLGYKIQYEQQYWQFNTSQLKNKISALLNTDEFAQQTASNEMEKLRLEGQAVGLSQDELDLKVKQLKHDTEAYLRSLKDHAATLESIDKTITSLEGQKGSPETKALIDRLRAEKIAVRGLLSSEFNQIKSHYLTTAQQFYHRNTVLRSDGSIRDEGALAKYNYFSDLTFNDVILHRRTAGEIANQWVNSVISAGGVVVDAAGVARGFDFNSTYRDVHNDREFKRGLNAGYEKAKQKYGGN